MIEKVKALCLKYKEVLLYLIFGGLTTLVSLVTFYIPNGLLGVHELIANVISWVCAVAFAYVTNAKWVFDSEARTAAEHLRQIGSFVGGRLATLGVEELILLVFATWLGWNAMLVKIAAQIVVVVLNYVISKLWVFRKKKGE